MKFAWLLVPVLLLVALQAFFLDKTPERIEEARVTRMEELKASTMLPAYIASLFLGSFRAIAVDAAWLELERAEKEKRFYRKKEILQFIKFLQPRNEEVHMLLAWNMLFNMPAVVSVRDRWRWEKEGLDIYREAMETLPGSPFVHYQAGLDFWKKATPTVGGFEPRFIRMFMEDSDVQAWFSRDRRARRTPFECSIDVLHRAKTLLQDFPDRAYRSQGGLMCTDYFSDNIARNNFLYQAFYFRDRGVEKRRAAEKETDALRAQELRHQASQLFDQADAWLARGEEFCGAMIREYRFTNQPKNIVSMFRALLADLRRAIRVELTGSPRDILDTYMPILRKHGTLDERYIYSAALQAKVALSGDVHELNDSEVDSEPIPKGEWMASNLWPSDDVDYFRYWIVEKSDPFVPHEAYLIIRNPGALPLSLDIQWDYKGIRRTLSTGLAVREKMADDETVTYKIPLHHPGAYIFIFRSALPDAPETLDSSYAFRLVPSKK